MLCLCVVKITFRHYCLLKALQSEMSTNATHLGLHGVFFIIIIIIIIFLGSDFGVYSFCCYLLQRAWLVTYLEESSFVVYSLRKK